MPFGRTRREKFKTTMDLIWTIPALGGVVAFFLFLFGDFEAAHKTYQWSYGAMFAIVGLLFLLSGVCFAWSWLLARKREKDEEGRYKKGLYRKNW
jgi:hypothetical protein